MTWSSLAALFGAMVVLAAVPGVSALAVSARAATSGFAHGAMVTAGIVLGDIVFIVLAVFGLLFLAELIGDATLLIQVIGGSYLLWLGLSFWRTRNASAAGADRGDAEARVAASSSASLRSSFSVGLLITLADQKAVLFYLGFLPAFVDLSAMTMRDALAIVAIAVIAVGSVKLCYAWAGARAGATAAPGMGRLLHLMAACVMLGVGVFLLFSAAAGLLR